MRILKYFLVVILLGASNTLFSQGVNITVQVLQSISPKAKLLCYRSGEFIAVDSTGLVNSGIYKFQLDNGYQKGLYKVEVGKSINFSIIVNNEPNIDILTVVYSPEDSLRTFNSKENSVFWQYQKQKKAHKQLTWYIKSLMDYYSDTSVFFSQLLVELNNQTRIFNNYVRKLTEDNKQLLASKYINLEQQIDIPNTIERTEKKQFLVDRWWDNIDLSDSLIFNSLALHTKLWGFIELFYDDNLDKEEQDNAFINGISAFFNKNIDVNVKRKLREYLLDGFQDTDYEAVVDFIQYSSFGQLDALKPKPKETKKKFTPKTRVGDKAYDFEVKGANGKNIKISKVNASYKLVLFWSSWCPHCIESLPRIKELYDLYKDKGFEVIAVSVDDDAVYWQRYINDFGLKWINIREDISLDSELFFQYDVNETPKMFLLSRDLTILSRPSTKKQLEVKLTSLLR